MPVRITIVCENTVGRPVPALGEHGFACLVEQDGTRWLFDTGRGDTLLHNLNVFEIDPHSIAGVVLSHGHNDHAGGLCRLLETAGRLPVHAHPGIFPERYWQGLHERRAIGMPATREQLVGIGADFFFHDQPYAIAPGLTFSGYIPRLSPDETGDPKLVIPAALDGQMTEDPFHDDAALAVATSRGLVIVLGCAHAGLINTVEHFRRHLQTDHVHAIIGGTHLGPASDRQFDATITYLADLNPDRIAVSHCTGQGRAAQLYARFPNKLTFANVGTVVEV